MTHIHTHTHTNTQGVIFDIWECVIGYNDTPLHWERKWVLQCSDWGTATTHPDHSLTHTHTQTHTHAHKHTHTHTQTHTHTNAHTHTHTRIYTFTYAYAYTCECIYYSSELGLGVRLGHQPSAGLHIPVEGLCSSGQQTQSRAELGPQEMHSRRTPCWPAGRPASRVQGCGFEPGVGVCFSQCRLPGSTDNHITKTSSAQLPYHNSLKVHSNAVHCHINAKLNSMHQMYLCMGFVHSIP